MFTTTLALAPGLYLYKFIVDGVWLASPREPAADDGKGNVNNVLQISSPPWEDADADADDDDGGGADKGDGGHRS